MELTQVISPCRMPYKDNYHLTLIFAPSTNCPGCVPFLGLAECKKRASLRTPENVVRTQLSGLTLAKTNIYVQWGCAFSLQFGYV